MKLDIESATLKPLIEAVIAETLAKVEKDRAKIGERLAFGEQEAARMLGLRSHQLRDERRRGRIEASVGPGRKILYSRDDLTRYLMARRWKED